MATDRGELLHGTLEMLILRCLTEGPMHGFAITERMERVTGEVLSVNEGSMYPALYRMQRRSWITSAWGKSENNRRARFYTLTPEGKQQFEAARAKWSRFSEAVDKVLQPA